MKREKLFALIGEIDETYVGEARGYRGDQKTVIRNIAAAAACFALVFMAALTVIPRVFDGADPISPVGTEANTEAIFETKYSYSVTDGEFSAYEAGKVIDAEKIGEKRGDVLVSAGWIDSNHVWSEKETLRGEIYSIIGIPTEVAVALKFLDVGEAVTTTHYYVLLNPTVEYEAMEEYRIQPMMPNNPGDEAAGEMPE